MPVVINEIHITANVADQSNTTGDRPAAANQPPSSEQMETIVRLCVEEVMRLLKEKEER